MAKKKTTSQGQSNPFKSILIGLMLIGILVTGVTVFGNLFDAKNQARLTQKTGFTYQEVADTVRELRQRQMNLYFDSPFGPGVLREAPERRRI